MRRLITFLLTFSILAAVSVGASNERFTAVDLGLSVKWATCNLGASTPEEYGDYYAWGETAPKQKYSWTTYKWCDGSYDTSTKYNTSTSYGTVDYKTELEAADDVAWVELGGKWRMPTDEEWTELRTNCTWTWTSQSGVNGYMVTSRINGKSIFLPAAGNRVGATLSNVGSRGYYWSSSLYTDYPYYAWSVYFYSGGVYRDSSYRYYGLSVRPVLDPDPAPVEKITAVDLGLSVKWANCNLGATTPEGYGDYYAWGETAPKSSYIYDTYKWFRLEEYYWGSITVTKYNTGAAIGDVDNKTVLDPGDDVAHVKLGGKWRIPTDHEWIELIENSDWTWTTRGGVNGFEVTSVINGKSIFLPAAGQQDGTSLDDTGSNGYYWSSSLWTDLPYDAWRVEFNTDNIFWGNGKSRHLGFSVRPVTE